MNYLFDLPNSSFKYIKVAMIRTGILFFLLFGFLKVTNIWDGFESNIIMLGGFAITRVYLLNVPLLGWEHLFIGNLNVGRNTNTAIKTVGGFTIATFTIIILPINGLQRKVPNKIVCIELRTFQLSIM